MATAPDGSAVAQAAGDGSPPAGGFMDVNVAMRMVAAAEAAAEAARAATNLASRSTSEDQGKSWWKLFPRPPVFDHSSRESEIAGWKEWSWMFEQYVASVDTRFSDDVQQIRSNLNTTVDPVDFSDSEKQRNSFFYSLLSSLFTAETIAGCSTGFWLKWLRGLQVADSTKRTSVKEPQYGLVERDHELAYVFR